jgi:hypothetical protein
MRTDTGPSEMLCEEVPLIVAVEAWFGRLSLSEHVADKLLYVRSNSLLALHKPLVVFQHQLELLVELLGVDTTASIIEPSKKPMNCPRVRKALIETRFVMSIEVP